MPAGTSPVTAYLTYFCSTGRNSQVGTACKFWRLHLLLCKESSDGSERTWRFKVRREAWNAGIFQLFRCTGFNSDTHEWQGALMPRLQPQGDKPLNWAAEMMVCRKRSPPPTTWVSVIQLRLSGLVASSFICQAVSPVQEWAICIRHSEDVVLTLELGNADWTSVRKFGGCSGLPAAAPEKQKEVNRDPWQRFRW